MTNIFRPDQNERWRKQADKAAVELKAALDKRHPYHPDKPMIPDPARIGFAFDDGFVTIEVSRLTIAEKSKEELADFLYTTVITATQAPKGQTS